MKDWKFYLLTVLLIILTAGCAGAASDGDATQPAVTITSLPSATPFTPLTNTPTLLPTATETATPTPEPTATNSPEPSPTPTSAPVTLIGAGDISFCGADWIGDENTAEILAQYPEAAIFTTGDNVYGEARAVEFQNCFGPTWGRFKDRIRPSLGNHDYASEGAAPYFAYFGEAAGEPGKGYYSFDVGDWHIIALNSNCNEVACRNDSQQVAWLREDLQNNDKKCTLMYWHHPLFTSGPSGNYGAARSFWQAAYEFGVDVVVNGHEHSYERFAPQDPGGNAVPDGIRQFVVGTGGAPLRWWEATQPNSEIQNNVDHGVIKFTLHPNGYEWEFIPVAGGSFSDSGSAECH